MNRRCSYQGLCSHPSESELANEIFESKNIDRKISKEKRPLRKTSSCPASALRIRCAEHDRHHQVITEQPPPLPLRTPASAEKPIALHLHRQRSNSEGNIANLICNDFATITCEPSSSVSHGPIFESASQPNFCRNCVPCFICDRCLFAMLYHCIWKDDVGYQEGLGRLCGNEGSCLRNAQKVSLQSICTPCLPCIIGAHICN